MLKKYIERRLVFFIYIDNFITQDSSEVLVTTHFSL